MVARLPDFLVIEDMRCGSSALYKTLSSHSKLFLPDTKELHFFPPRLKKSGASRQAQNNMLKIEVSVKRQLISKFQQYRTFCLVRATRA